MKNMVFLASILDTVNTPSASQCTQGSRTSNCSHDLVYFFTAFCVQRKALIQVEEEVYGWISLVPYSAILKNKEMTRIELRGNSMALSR